MGILDDFVSNAAGAIPQVNSEAGPSKGMLEMLGSSEIGGLDGLVNLFQSKGLGGIVSSWIGKGTNLPISPEQIREVFGSDVIQHFARRLGTNAQEAPSLIAKLLPTLVDKLTPDGNLPEGDLLSRVNEILPSNLQGILGGKGKP